MSQQAIFQLSADADSVDVNILRLDKQNPGHLVREEKNGVQ